MAATPKNKYRNKKTGAVIVTTHKISGSDWELVKGKKAADPSKETAGSSEEGK